MSEWISIEAVEMPEEFESIAGLNCKWNNRFAGHLESGNFVSDETGDVVFITHWMKLPESPKE